MFEQNFFNLKKKLYYFVPICHFSVAALLPKFYKLRGQNLLLFLHRNN